MEKEYKVLYRYWRRKVVINGLPKLVRKMLYRKPRTKFTQFVIRMYVSGGIRK